MPISVAANRIERARAREQMLHAGPRAVALFVARNGNFSESFPLLLASIQTRRKTLSCGTMEEQVRERK
jgi:hypothetical protein